MRAAALPSIAGRLNRLVAVSVGLALALAAVLSAWHESERYAASKRETMLATAQVFGSAASQAIAAGDSVRVMQVLRAVARVPGLLHAEVRDPTGRVMADIGEAVRLSGDARIGAASQTTILDMLRGNTIEIRVPVIDHGRTVGELRLISDTAGLGRQLLLDLLQTLAASAATLLVGLVLANRLQRSISGPLIAMTQAMAQARPANDYPPIPETGQDRETLLLARSFNGMIRTIGAATREILAREDEIIGRLSRAAEQRDDQTGQHVARVAKVSRIIADGMGLDPAFVRDLERASPMHDVGKISVPDAILHKPGRLDARERAIMETHAAAGHLILSGSKAKLVQLAAEIALTHHERWDGKGYPNGLRGEAIPLSGRITAVADVCDALLSDRPYKRAWSLGQVREHLLDHAGAHFDPACVEALLARWQALEAVYAEGAGRERQGEAGIARKVA